MSSTADLLLGPQTQKSKFSWGMRQPGDPPKAAATNPAGDMHSPIWGVGRGLVSTENPQLGSAQPFCSRSLEEVRYDMPVS